MTPRSVKRGSVAGDAVHQGVTDPSAQHHPAAFFKKGKRGSTASEPGNLAGNESGLPMLNIQNNNHNRRHRPSAVAAHVLTSVSETEQEESDPEPSPQTR
ncbi:hypothetical protein CDAR_525141 [Caerostris darwini]|uniref:Uncharacterized protein n=1 Tax=Caerostris darwini TaxID=1538125 RepID=A0AAV4SJ73_9ARAC|nr:hypothetical protein CDAR_525141 [Caerostris darwini]